MSEILEESTKQLFTMGRQITEVEPNYLWLSLSSYVNQEDAENVVKGRNDNPNFPSDYFVVKETVIVKRERI